MTVYSKPAMDLKVEQAVAAERDRWRSVTERLLESYLATFNGNKDTLAHEAEQLLSG